MTDRQRTTTIAIEGIDGSGKSTVIDRLLTLISRQACSARVMRCPAYHETTDAPLADLSRALYRFSQCADTMGSFPLKTMALSLQMTLYGPIAGFLSQTLQPDILISERHAILAGMAYGPFYTTLMQQPLERAGLEEELSTRLETSRAGTMLAIAGWVELEARRLGFSADFWTYYQHIVEVFTSGAGLIERLAREYRTALPDVLILLDLKPDTAAARLKNRPAKIRELHETTDTLQVIQQQYYRIIEQLRAESPVQIHVIPAGEDAAISEIVQAVLDRIGA